MLPIKMGGAHVDEQLTKEYAALAADGSLGELYFTISDDSIKEAHYVAIRQMAYEVLNSPDLLKFCDAIG